MAIVNPSAGAAIPNVTTFASVNLFSDVRALGAGQYPVVSVLGRTTVGDGYDGIFYWNSTSTAADDNQDVLLPNSGGNGRWLRLFSSLTLSTGATHVSTIQSGIGQTGAISRTVSDMFSERISLMNALTVAQRAEVRAGTKTTDYRSVVQAYLDGIVAQGRKTVVVVEPGTVWRLDSGITIDCSLIQLQAQGATFSFAQQTSGSAISLTKADLQVSLGGLRIEGNSNAGSVTGIEITGTVGNNVNVIALRDFVVTTFGTGVHCGNYAYLLSFEDFDIADCTTSFLSDGSTGGGSRIVLYNFLITSTVSGAIGIKNNNINADIYCFGGAIETPVLVNQTGGRIQCYGTHMENADYTTTPIVLDGGSNGAGMFQMFGGEILSNQATITAQNLVSIANVTVGIGGADFHGVYFQFGNTASGNFAGGALASECRIFNPRGTYAFKLYSGVGNVFNNIAVKDNWTPVDSSGASLTFTSVTGNYVCANGIVWFSFGLTFPVTANGTAVLIGGLPISSNGAGMPNQITGYLVFSDYTVAPIQLVGGVGATTFNLYKGGNTQLVNSDLSSKTIRMAGWYRI